MLLKSSSNADDRQAHDFLGLLVIPNYDSLSHFYSDGETINA
jgi:hypothetical protein